MNDTVEVHTINGLVAQMLRGRDKASLVLWITENTKAVECPECGEILRRERRIICEECKMVYPEKEWANGKPCPECNSMNARYAGRHSANRYGWLEFQLCLHQNCKWGNHYRPLTVQEVADAVETRIKEGLY